LKTNKNQAQASTFYHSHLQANCWVCWVQTYWFSWKTNYLL